MKGTCVNCHENNPEGPAYALEERGFICERCWIKYLKQPKTSKRGP